MYALVTSQPAELDQATKVEIKNRWLLPSLGLITLLAFLLRLFRLDHTPNWDEVYQYQSSAYPLSLIIPKLWPDHTPLYFFFSHFVLDLTNYNHEMAWLRLPAVIIGTFVPLTTYILAREISNDYRVGLLAAFMTVFAPLTLEMSQYYRMYALLIVLANLMAFCFLRALRYNQPGYWLAFVGLSIVNLYNHYNTVLILGQIGAFGLLWLGLNITARVFPASRLKDWIGKPARWWQGGAALVFSIGLIFVLYLPWLSHFLSFMGNSDYGVNSGLHRVAITPRNISRYIEQISFGSNWTSRLAALVAIAGGSWLLWRRSYYGLFCLAYIGLMLGFIWAQANGNIFFQESRYYSFITPVYLIVLCQGLMIIPKGLAKLNQRLQISSRFISKKWLRLVGPALIALILAGSGWQSLKTVGEAYDAAAVFKEGFPSVLQGKIQPQDAVLLFTPENAVYDEETLEFSTTTFITTDGPAQFTLQSHFMRVGKALAISQLQYLKASFGKVWLGILTQSWQQNSGATQAALGNDLVVNCGTVCYVSFKTTTNLPSEYEQSQLLLNRFRFLDPSLVTKMQSWFALSLRNLPPPLVTNPGPVRLTDQPVSIELPLGVNTTTKTFLLAFKYQGAVARVNLKLRTVTGEVNPLMASWSGFTPLNDGVKRAEGNSDSLLFETPPGASTAIVELSGEAGAATVSDLQIFNLSP